MGIADRSDYRGDVNLEHGGVFVNLAQWDYRHVECVRVEPDEDAEYGWIIDRLVVVLDLRPLEHLLSQRSGSVLEMRRSMNYAAWQMYVIQECICYGAYDVKGGETFHIDDADALEAYLEREWITWVDVADSATVFIGE